MRDSRLVAQSVGIVLEQIPNLIRFPADSIQVILRGVGQVRKRVCQVRQSAVEFGLGLVNGGAGLPQIRGGILIDFLPLFDELRSQPGTFFQCVGNGRDVVLQRQGGKGNLKCRLIVSGGNETGDLRHVLPQGGQLLENGLAVCMNFLKQRANFLTVSSRD